MALLITGAGTPRGFGSTKEALKPKDERSVIWTLQLEKIFL